MAVNKRTKRWRSTPELPVVALANRHSRDYPDPNDSER
jgi:hypothetical protein